MAELRWRARRLYSQEIHKSFKNVIRDLWRM
jgi:hypothetical protein